MDSLLTRLNEGRGEFLALVADIRPDLHRYCARMVGSITEGEDIVQETLARAFYALPQQVPMPPLRPWLFRIAHNCASDHLRRAERRMTESLDETLPAEVSDAEEQLARGEAVRTALSQFMELVPAQRSAVILKDVLGHSLEEMTDLLGASLPAVKATLHRGRARLAQLNARPTAAAECKPVSPTLARWAALFNARDWDGLRAMLTEDAKLDLVSRTQRSGPPVGDYFTNYARRTDVHFVPGWLDGREVLGVMREGEDRPFYFVELELSAQRVQLIRDFYFVPYIAQDATFVRATDS